MAGVSLEGGGLACGRVVELVASSDEGGREMADSLSDAEVLDELKQWKVNRPSKPSRLLPKSSFG